MKRTQLYLDDALWEALHVRSRETGVSLSELVRQAARERYLTGAGRNRAMQALVGLWTDRRDLPNAETYVRRLRRGKRRKAMVA